MRSRIESVYYNVSFAWCDDDDDDEAVAHSLYPFCMTDEAIRTQKQAPLLR